MTTESSGKNPMVELMRSVGGVGAFSLALLTGIATIVKQMATIQQHRKDALALLSELTYYTGVAVVWTYLVFFVAAILVGIVLGLFRVSEKSSQTLLLPVFFLCLGYAVYMTINDPETEKNLAAHDAWTYVAQIAGVCVLLWAVYAIYYMKAWLATHMTATTDGKE